MALMITVSKMITVSIPRMALGMVALLVSTTSWAGTWNVTTAADEFDGTCDQHCSLRDAVHAANAMPESSLIHLPANVYSLTLAGPNENGGKTGDLDITGQLTVEGAGDSSTILDGQGKDRLFHVLPSGRLTLKGVTVRNGSAVSSIFNCGGAILNAGELSLMNTSVQNSSAASGGGICNQGVLTIDHGNISSNTATSGNGGGIEQAGPSANVVNSVIKGNRALKGGGIDFSGEMISCAKTEISRNTATEQGGGIWAGNSAKFGITDTTIAQNEAPVGNDCVGFIQAMGQYLLGDPQGCKIVLPVVVVPSLGSGAKVPDIGKPRKNESQDTMKQKMPEVKRSPVRETRNRNRQ